MDQSKLLERPYKKLLNECFSFEMCHSELKLRAIKDRLQNQQKSPFAS